MLSFWKVISWVVIIASMLLEVLYNYFAIPVICQDRLYSAITGIPKFLSKIGCYMHMLRLHTVPATVMFLIMIKAIDMIQYMKEQVVSAEEREQR